MTTNSCKKQITHVSAKFIPSEKIALVWNIHVASTTDELRFAYIVSKVWAGTPSNRDHSVCPLCNQITHYDYVSHYVASHPTMPHTATYSLLITLIESVKQLNGHSLSNELISDIDDQSVLRKVLG